MRYIREEHAHHLEIFQQGQRQLLESLKNVRVDPNAPSLSVPEKEENKSTNFSKADDDIKVTSHDLKKLYRKIVQETHPDKLIGSGFSDKEVKKRNDLYVRAVKAVKDADEDTLIELAVDLDIEIDMDEARIAAGLHSRGKKLEIEIQQIKKSVEWFWVSADEKSRIDIIKQICQRNGWIYVSEDQIINTIRRVVGTHPGAKEDIRTRARLNKNSRITLNKE